MLISIPPKYSVSQVVGYIKGKSAIHLARVYGERKRNFVGRHFWAAFRQKFNDYGLDLMCQPLFRVERHVCQYRTDGAPLRGAGFCGEEFVLIHESRLEPFL